MYARIFLIGYPLDNQYTLKYLKTQSDAVKIIRRNNFNRDRNSAESNTKDSNEEIGLICFENVLNLQKKKEDVKQNVSQSDHTRFVSFISFSDERWAYSDGSCNCKMLRDEGVNISNKVLCRYIFPEIISFMSVGI